MGIDFFLEIIKMTKECDCECVYSIENTGVGFCFNPANSSLDISIERCADPSGTGVCDIIYGTVCIGAVYCVSGEVQPSVTADWPVRTLSLDIQSDYLSSCEEYGGIGGTLGERITGIPLSYNDFSQAYCGKVSYTVCGIDTSACSGTGIYETCYYVSAAVEPINSCEETINLNARSVPRDELRADNGGLPICNKYQEKLVYDRIDPFSEGGGDVNVWLVAKKAIEAQQTYPEQSGILANPSSYIGLV